MKNDNLQVRPVTFDEVVLWCLQKHYSKRVPSISYAFGLYDESLLIGIVTYGTPASGTLRAGVCGPEWESRVIELNRLCIEDAAPANAASRLVGRSLRLLPSPSIVVSFADTAQGHVGYVYQATNFTYTGLSAKRTDWKLRGREHLHGVSVADLSRGREGRAAYMRETYGDDFYLEDRSRKHRYVRFIGSRGEVRAMRKALRYEPCPYPKGQTRRYDSSAEIPIQLRMTEA